MFPFFSLLDLVATLETNDTS